MNQRFASLLSAAMLAAFALPACGAANIVVPDSLQAPAGQKLAFETNATGVQIYICGASKADAAKFEWSLKAPDAELFDAAGAKVGKHYGGPTWEGNDGSKVVGEVKAKLDDPAGKAIPWLLLVKKSASGSGAFGKVSAIQRLATEAGKAPADGCSQESAGKETRVPYQAVYRFYVPA